MNNKIQKEQFHSLSEKYVSYLRVLSCSWSSHRAAKQLTPELIDYIKPRIHRCSTPLKVRILTSFLYLSPALLRTCSTQLSYLLHSTETDRDDWVRKLSRLLQPFVATGHLDLREIDTETAYRTIKYLDEQSALTDLQYRLKPPLEFSRVYDVTRDFAQPPDNNFSTDNAVLHIVGAVPPAPLLETVHFRASSDIFKPMREIEAHGLQALLREVRQFETLQDKRKMAPH